MPATETYSPQRIRAIRWKAARKLRLDPRSTYRHDWRELQAVAELLDGEKSLKAQEVAEMLGVSISSVHAYRQAGLNTEIHGLTELFFNKLTFIQNQNNVILRAMVRAGQLDEANIPKEPL